MGLTYTYLPGVFLQKPCHISNRLQFSGEIWHDGTVKRIRRRYLIAFGIGILLLFADVVQRWIYVQNVPTLSERLEQGKGLENISILVAGVGLDDAEMATGMRDLKTAQQAILGNQPGRNIVYTLHPGQSDYSVDRFRSLVKNAQGAERLLIFLTGHGGGFNFGATSRLNLKNPEVFELLSELKVGSITLVVDCCWSGQFALEMTKHEFKSPVTLITSTDAKHPAPFPVSFLSPKSFGATWFGYLGLGEEGAFQATNRWRKKLKILYPENFGLMGTWTKVPDG